MRLDLSFEPPTVTVTLSERNLRALLAKLELPGSLRTITGGHCYWDGQLVDLTLVLVAQPDREHYADREPAGLMHPDTEALISRQQQPDDNNDDDRSRQA